MVLHSCHRAKNECLYIDCVSIYRFQVEAVCKNLTPIYNIMD